MRNITVLSLIFFACLLSTRGQYVPKGPVIPSVCVETTYYSGAVTLAEDAAAGAGTIKVNGYVPPLISLTVNPGGSNEQTIPYVGHVESVNGTDTYKLVFNQSLQHALHAMKNAVSSAQLAQAHTAGETVRFNGYSGRAYLGYHNTTNSVVNIARGVSAGNFFSPGPLVYNGQPVDFLPGMHNAIFSVAFGGKPEDMLNWFLGDRQATALQ